MRVPRRPSRDGDGRRRLWFMPALPRREARSAQSLPAVKHLPPAVQTYMDVDAAPGVAAAARARLELKQPTLKRDGVVVSDGAVVLEAADAVKGGRR